MALEFVEGWSCGQCWQRGPTMAVSALGGARRCVKCARTCPVENMFLAVVNYDLGGRTLMHGRRLVLDREARWVLGAAATLKLVPLSYQVAFGEVFIEELVENFWTAAWSGKTTGAFCGDLAQHCPNDERSRCDRCGDPRAE